MFDDNEAASQILKETNPASMKRPGKQVKRGHPQITSHLGGREGVLQVVTWCDKGEEGVSLMCDITF